jgi:hypothetical protein
MFFQVRETVLLSIKWDEATTLAIDSHKFSQNLFSLCAPC